MKGKGERKKGINEKIPISISKIHREDFSKELCTKFVGEKNFLVDERN